MDILRVLNVIEAYSFSHNASEKCGLIRHRNFRQRRFSASPPFVTFSTTFDTLRRGVISQVGLLHLYCKTTDAVCSLHEYSRPVLPPFALILRTAPWVT